MGSKGKKPSMLVEQYVAAHLLLCAPGGKIGVRDQEYWRKLRGLAQQQLYLNDDLEREALNDLRKTLDPALHKMLEMVKFGMKVQGFNQYHQAQRDAFATNEHLFYVINSDIVMILDKSDHIIGFQCCDSFRELLQKGVEDLVLNGYRTYGILQPQPFPDGTRHGLHWADWLRKRPENDFRHPSYDKNWPSTVTHHGGGFTVGNTSGTGKMYAKRDSGERLQGASEHVLEQYANLRKSCFGACTEILSFFFEILEPGLFDEYKKVAEELDRRGDPKIIGKSRPGLDVFSITALLLDVHTTEHKDASDWPHGFAGLLPLGEYTGGDLLLRELGLQIVTPAGCAQLIRGRELRHSITEYTGHRAVPVMVTHKAMMLWAKRGIKGQNDDSDSQDRQNKRKLTESDDYDEEAEVKKSKKESAMANKSSKVAKRPTTTRSAIDRQ